MLRLTPVLRALALTVLVAAEAAAQPRGGRGGPPGGAQQDPLRFQMMGPASGGRFSAITGVPGDPRVWYVGAASGGVWKSSDSGATFVPVFDRQPVQAIGALAVAPSSPNMVWAGTGEAWVIRESDVMGDGIYLSTDSGATWTNMGLRETGRIGRILVHPTNPSIVYACTVGRATGPQQERGVYRTRDAGRTWERVLFVDENTGCSGLSMDGRDPNVLYAGTWQVVMHTWAMFSGGPGSGMYKSTDGGTTWQRIVHAGLPKDPIGKVDIDVAPSDPRRVYALIQTADQGSVWRSDDAGATWRVVNWARQLIGRAGYYINLEVSPANPDEILVANSSFFRSTDGGSTFVEVPWGGDNHDIWFDPTNADRIGLTNDASARITADHGRSWLSVGLPIGQMYHVAVDNQTPYWMYSNRQDNGTMRGPSTTPEANLATRGIAAPEGRGAPGAGRGGRGGGGDTLVSAPRALGGTGVAPNDTAAMRRMGVRPAGDSAAARDTAGAPAAFGGGGGGFGFGGGSTWDHGVGGCESGFTIPDPTDPDIVWATCYGNEVTRWNAKTKTARSVSPWIHTLDSPPNDLKYRCHWTPPLAIDPFDHNTVYYGCQVIFRTRDSGDSWQVVSPDLSTRDPSRVVPSGGVVGDNLGQFYGEVVFAIAPSAVQRGLVWAGTNDGKVWVTRDGATTWTDLTKNLTGMPAWSTIRKIEPSPFDAGTAYVVADRHTMDDRRPYLFKTTDYGRTWTSVVGDLPAGHTLDYVLSVAENPNRKGMLFAGTGRAFYYSLDDGAHWTAHADGLPAAPVTWIVVPKKWHDVVVSTYGRGIYLLRDITPLEQKDRVVASASSAQLYAPRPGYRQARGGRADITFSLPAATARPVRLEILDSSGTVIRTLQVPTRAGLNRATWDLRYEPAKRPELRTAAVQNPHIWDEPRFKGQTTRPITHWGIQQPQVQGPLALPGHYRVRLSMDSTSAPSAAEAFTVMKDLDIAASDADLLASTRMQLRVRAALDTAVGMINRLETIRKQLADQRTANAGKADALAAIDSLDRALLEVEMRMASSSDLNSDDKYFVDKPRTYLSLIWLMGVVGSGGGDVAGGADSRPTAASRAQIEELERDLKSTKAVYERVLREQGPALSRLLGNKIANIIDR